MGYSTTKLQPLELLQLPPSYYEPTYVKSLLKKRRCVTKIRKPRKTRFPFGRFWNGLGAGVGTTNKILKTIVFP